MEMKRLFVAVDLPEELKKDIYGFARQLEQDGIKLVEEKNLHITIRFIGEVPDETVPEIVSRLEKIKFQEFECKIKGVGVFPNPSYIRVVWVGLESGQLAQLANSVLAALKGIGKEEERGFSAHLTIARVKKKADLQKFLEKNREREFGKFKVGSFVLFESRLTPNGPAYAKLRTFTSG